MSSFKIAFHSVTGRRMVEVWDGAHFIAAIYPGDGSDFKIVSKFPINTTERADEQVNETTIIIG
jgi:hypothetical protein